MTFFQAIILGLIQGLGEFLPISSSGHLVLAPWLLGFSDPGLSFDVALHLGTLFAVILYFWKDWVELLITNCQLLIANFFSKSAPPATSRQLQQRNLFLLIIIATIPGALFGYFLENYAETAFRNPLLVAFTLSLAGLVLFLADKYARHEKDIAKTNKKDAFLIGLSQALAIIPGVSRAGTTITAGLLLGLTRKDAARFSFLASAPIILGAVVLKIPEFLASGITQIELVGILTAALSGYAAISWMIKFIEKVSYKVFFWYRLTLAVLILIFSFLK